MLRRNVFIFLSDGTNTENLLPIFRADLPEECLVLLLLSQSDLFLLRLRFLGEDSISLSRSEQDFFANNFGPRNLFSLAFETSIFSKESEREHKYSTYGHNYTM
jgi:hypothetical protein